MTLEQVCTDHYSIVYRRCLSGLNFNEELAGEITQEVFLLFIEKWSALQNHENIIGWLCTTADHKVKEYYRASAKSKVVISINDENFIEPCEELNMVEEIERFRLMRNLDQYEAEILRQLKEKDIELIQYLQSGMKYDKIAAKMNKTKGAVSMNVTRLKRKVKDIIKIM